MQIEIKKLKWIDFKINVQIISLCIRIEINVNLI